MLVRCLGEPGSLAIDTKTGAESSPAPPDAVPLLVTAGALRASLGLSGECYMERALACAALPLHVLEALYPPGEGEHPRRRMGSQASTLRRLGLEVRPDIAQLLIKLRASARVCEKTGRRKLGRNAEAQRTALARALAGQED